MKTKLPKTLFVVLEEEGTNEEYLRCEKQPEDVAKQGVKKRGGIYELKELVTVEGAAKIIHGH